MKKITRMILLSVFTVTLATFGLCMFGNTAYARTKNKPNEYVYYDMDSWRRYLSTEEPNCRHTKRRAYRYVYVPQVKDTSNRRYID